MRRGLPVIIALAVAVGVAACGGSSTPNATMQALSYFPGSTPLVATIVTDSHSPAVQQALSQAQGSATDGALIRQLVSQLAQRGISYDRDIRPLFGNPIALGTVQASLSSSGSQPFLAAWVTRSASTLRSLISKLRIHSTGTHDGAKLYASGRTVVAVDGATLLVASSTSTITAALDRHANGTGLGASAYARDTGGLRGSLVTVFGDLTSALSSTRAAAAGKIPWVAAIRGYGIGIATAGRNVTIRYHVDTGGRQLTSGQLPIATGSAAPALAGSLPIELALRDPAQSVDFVISAIQAADPAAYAKVVAAEAAVKATTGVSISSLISSLSGDLRIESDGHTTLASSGLSDPSAFSSALAKLAQLSAAGGSSAIRALGSGFYAMHSGRTTLIVGVASNELVAGNATPAQLAAFASAPASPAAAGGGAVAFRLALPSLLPLVLRNAPSAAEQQILSLLGTMSGAVQATTGGLTGSATLTAR